MVYTCINDKIIPQFVLTLNRYNDKMICESFIHSSLKVYIKLFEKFITETSTYKCNPRFAPNI